MSNLKNETIIFSSKRKKNCNKFAYFRAYLEGKNGKKMLRLSKRLLIYYTHVLTSVVLYMMCYIKLKLVHDLTLMRS